LKDEVRGKALLIALHLLVENSDRHTIKLSNIGVQDDSLMAKKQDARFHRDSRHTTTFRHPEQLCTFSFFHLKSPLVTSIMIREKWNTFAGDGVNSRPFPFWSDAAACAYVMLTSV
jgi:hypothetical protein